MPGASWLITRSSGWLSSRAVLSMAVMMSPSWTPALAAGLSATTAEPVWPDWPGRIGSAADEGAVVDRQAVGLLDGRVDRLELDAEPRPGQRLTGRRLGHERPGDVDRDGEADVLGLTRRRRC